MRMPMMNNFDSDSDPKLLDRRLMHQLNIANEWYRSNGMLAIPPNTRT